MFGKWFQRVNKNEFFSLHMTSMLPTTSERCSMSLIWKRIPRRKFTIQFILLLHPFWRKFDEQCTVKIDTAANLTINIVLKWHNLATSYCLIIMYCDWSRIDCWEASLKTIHCKLIRLFQNNFDRATEEFIHWIKIIWIVFLKKKLSEYQ